jgi:hypothetical protein
MSTRLVMEATSSHGQCRSKDTGLIPFFIEPLLVYDPLVLSLGLTQARTRTCDMAITMNHKQIPNCAQNELNHSIITGEATGTTGTG